MFRNGLSVKSSDPPSSLLFQTFIIFVLIGASAESNLGMFVKNGVIIYVAQTTFSCIGNFIEGMMVFMHVKENKIVCHNFHNSDAVSCFFR